MADTVDLNNITEYHNSEAELEKGIQELVELIKTSKHTIFFTGAGISTSASIPDFRGPNGAWTRKAQGKQPPSSVPITQAIPTSCHMSIASLLEENQAQYVISQNIDGLHRRSGVPATKISELHGNCYLETCWHCPKEFLRTYDVSSKMIYRNAQSCGECRDRVPHFCHCTARKCPDCPSHPALKDSIIHFKENLPMKALQSAFEHGKKADLCIVLGSSLTVSPACQIPQETVKNGGKLVIVNLQKTPLDRFAHLRLFAKTDDVMERTMKGLKLTLPTFAESTAAKEESKRVAAEATLKQQERQSFFQAMKSSLGAALSSATSSSPSFSISSSSSSSSSSSAISSPGAANDITLSGGQTTDLGRRSGDRVAPTPTTDTTDVTEDLGGAVVPKRNCPHVSRVGPITISKATALMKKGCDDCGDQKENWTCLECHAVGCCRYVQGHMKAHGQSAQHNIVMSFGDLNVWCYDCNSYVLMPEIEAAHQTFYLVKFGSLPASATGKRP